MKWRWFTAATCRRERRRQLGGSPKDCSNFTLNLRQPDLSPPQVNATAYTPPCASITRRKGAPNKPEKVIPSRRGGRPILPHAGGNGPLRGGHPPPPAASYLRLSRPFPKGTGTSPPPRRAGNCVRIARISACSAASLAGAPTSAKRRSSFRSIITSRVRLPHTGRYLICGMPASEPGTDVLCSAGPCSALPR